MTLQSPPFRRTFDNERGMALVIALVLLCVLTVIGMAATNTSVIETLISGTERQKQEAFYVAEAGIEHTKTILKSLFVQRNADEIASALASGSSPNPDWDFALNGSESGVATASGANYAGGAVWITNGTVGGSYTYNVRVWNNQDGGGAANDTDRLIYVRSEAIGPHRASASIEVALQGGVSGKDSITGYTAQAGSGAGKNYNANDVDSITDFSAQM